MADKKSQLKLNWQTCSEPWDAPIDATSVVYDNDEWILCASADSFSISFNCVNVEMTCLASEAQAQLAAERIYGAITAELDAMRNEGVL